MPVHYIEDKDGYKTMYCSTTMWAFGPVFYPEDDVESFLTYCKEKEISPRILSDSELSLAVRKWRDSRTKYQAWAWDNKDQDYTAPIGEPQLTIGDAESLASAMTKKRFIVEPINV